MQWPAIEMSPTNAVLRSSPSVARMLPGAARPEAVLSS
jgi:hypothetical protein